MSARASIPLVLSLVACGAGAAPTVIAVPAPREATPLAVAATPTETRPSGPFVLALGGDSPCVLRGTQVLCRQNEAALGAQPLEGRSDVASVGFGRAYVCFSLLDRRLACGGDNRYGQLGAGIAAEKASLVVLGMPATAKKVVAGPFTACAILVDGRLACWGKNEAGESGSATNVLPDAREVVEPEIVPGLSDVTEVAIAWSSACAATAKGDVYCWGKTILAEHEKARGPRHEAPTRIAALTGATSLAASAETFCAIAGGKVVCWGRDGLLLPTTDGSTLTEVKVRDARSVCLGSDHGCALDARGKVHCFGSAYAGALGVLPTHGDYRAHLPAEVAGIPKAVEVGCGRAFSCARTESDELYCWGRLEPSGEPTPPTRLALVP